MLNYDLSPLLSLPIITLLSLPIIPLFSPIPPIITSLSSPIPPHHDLSSLLSLPIITSLSSPIPPHHDLSLLSYPSPSQPLSPPLLPLPLLWRFSSHHPSLSSGIPTIEIVVVFLSPSALLKHSSAVPFRQGLAMNVVENRIVPAAMVTPTVATLPSLSERFLVDPFKQLRSPWCWFGQVT